MTNTYDVIIVGGGTAGAVLGARLSADPGTSVLVLEAGPDHSSAEAPAGIQSVTFVDAFMVPDHIWPTLSASFVKGEGERFLPRGRGVGGSSGINAMGVLRGSQDDYERWAGELGCPGWGWPEMLQAFRRAEDDVDYGGDELHGAGGPLPLWRTPMDQLPPIDRAARQAMAQLGYDEADDYHDPKASGVSRWALSWRDGRRFSTNDAYLQSARSRPNLEVRGDVLVDRLLLDGRRATGVRTIAGAEIEGGQVILCAGAIHSPAILLRSAIGVDDGLPVGRNLIEHPKTPELDIALKPAGRLAAPDVSMVTSVLRYTSGLADAGLNDMQIGIVNSQGSSQEALATGMMYGAVMRVFSRGEVRLRSQDPTVDPIVEFNLFSDERDVVRLRDSVNRMFDIVRHPAMESIIDGVSALGAPIEEPPGAGELETWLAGVQSVYGHASGTCRMGTPGDPAAVVDTDCRVIGYENLRVCDASVMPDIPKANTYLTTVAIAERLVTKMGETPA